MARIRAAVHDGGDFAQSTLYRGNALIHLCGRADAKDLKRARELVEVAAAKAKDEDGGRYAGIECYALRVLAHSDDKDSRTFALKHLRSAFESEDTSEMRWH